MQIKKMNENTELIFWLVLNLGIVFSVLFALIRPIYNDRMYYEKEYMNTCTKSDTFGSYYCSFVAFMMFLNQIIGIFI